jgi:hypothetical protein
MTVLFDKSQIAAVVVPVFLSVVKRELFLFFDILACKKYKHGSAIDHYLSNADIWLSILILTRHRNITSKVIEVSRFIAARLARPAPRVTVIAIFKRCNQTLRV